MSIKNIIRNSLKKGYLNVMVDKVVKRIKEPQLARNKQIATEWCAANAVDDTIYLQKIDASLYDEALSFNQKLHNEADEIIKKLPFKMGAGGNCILIYFLTKYYRPKTVLETGVSMGYSSYTFLELLKQYDGQLFSSDFPYFRHANPEKYVGCIVPGDLKENWHLYTKGDVVNLQEILPQVSSIDLFHYDSDKSYEGREFAFHEVRPFLKENAIIVFDDINDNLHFKDLAEKYAEEYFVLKSVNGGYVGLITKQKKSVALKILFIQKEGGIFGAENYQLKIIPALLEEGIEIEFLRLYTDYQGGKGGDFIERLIGMGVKTHELNIGRIPKLSSLRKIKKLIHQNNFDIVHTHLIHADLHLSLIKLFLGGIKCPWVSTKHGYDNNFTAQYGFDASKQKKTPYFLLAQLSERLCDQSFTISHGLRNFFIKTGLAKKEKMKLIHYGFDFLDTSDELLDNDYKSFKKQVIIAGRLVGFKGHQYLIEAMQKLCAQDREAGLVIVGSGELEEELKQKVKELKLEEHVHFAGYSKEVIKWMYNSDLVAVPSISEGFGVVFLEAFNCKKPVISWDVPAGNELMKEGETGFLVLPYDTQALADKMAYILNHPKNAQEVGLKAHQELKIYYNLERMTKETIDFYESTLN